MQCRVYQFIMINSLINNLSLLHAARRTTRDYRAGITKPYSVRGKYNPTRPGNLSRGGYQRGGYHSKPAYDPYPRRAPQASNVIYKTIQNQQAHQTMENTLTRVLVSNLDFGVTIEDIRELYGEFGVARRMVLNYDKAGRSLGTAEIVYEKRSDALKAMQTYNGIPLDGKTMCVEVVANDYASTANSRVIPAANRLGTPANNRGGYSNRGSGTANNHYKTGDYQISYAHSAGTKQKNLGPTDYDNPRNHRGNNPFFRPSHAKNFVKHDRRESGAIKSDVKASKTAEELDKELDKYLMSKPRE